MQNESASTSRHSVVQNVRLILAVIFAATIILAPICLLVIHEINTRYEPLQAAAAANNVGAIIQLLKDGADINSKSRFRQWTALHVAADNGNSAAAAVLIEHGALIDPVDSDDFTPLCVAGAQPSGKSQDLSTEKGRNAVAQLLIANHANIDWKTKSGWNPLLCAVRSGDTELARILLAAGANRRATDSDGWSAIVYAKDAPKQRNELVRLLQDSK